MTVSSNYGITLSWNMGLKFHCICLNSRSKAANTFGVWSHFYYNCPCFILNDSEKIPENQREIPIHKLNFILVGTSSFFSGNLTHGKLCNSCNRMQVLKVKQLSSFIPSREVSWPLSDLWPWINICWSP